MFWDSVLVALDGRLEEALEMARRIQTRGDELGLSGFAVAAASVVGLRPRVYLGGAERALQRNLEGATAPHVKIFCLAHLGRDAEVKEMLERRVMARPGIGTAEDETSALDDIISLEAAVIVGNRQAADLLMRRLAGSSVRTNGQNYTTCIARHLGAAAVLLGRPDEARAHYQEALRVTTEMRFRPELALTRLQLAELVLEHYPEERAEALEHLDFAITEFRDMKMQPSLERALKHKEILGA